METDQISDKVSVSVFSLSIPLAQLQIPLISPIPEKKVLD